MQLKINPTKMLLYISMYVMFCSCTSKEQPTIPKIKAGIAKVTGTVINYPIKQNKILPLLKIDVSYPVTAELKEYTTRLNEDGSFSFEIPLECNVITTIRFDAYSSGIGLVPGEETKIVIERIDAHKIKVNMNNLFGLTPEDMEKLNQITLSIGHAEYRSEQKNLDLDISPSDFSRSSLEDIDAMQKYIDEYPNISDNAKTMISNIVRIFMLKYPLFEYEEFVKDRYINYIYDSLSSKGVLDTIIRSEVQKAINNFKPQKIDKSYYSFLKNFDLNNPQNLYALDYPNVLQSILRDDALAIPLIENKPVNEWLKEVKTTMADLIGSDTGLFYDMLAANAYAKQFNDKTQPLSEIQKENIKNYFKNKSFVEILLKRNEEIAKVTAITSTLNINETPAVPNSKLMDAIVSKHKGKVVVVDFWATWCVPCMQAISALKEFKSKLLNKDIVFVYIANSSSPKKLWETKIQGIGGEQYYLDKGEWGYITDTFDFNGIPTYFLYDKTGELKNVGFLEPKKLQTWIEELLQ